MPFFSIVIPLFNRRREIRRALESCLFQTFADFEIVVVDDASQDDSVAVVSSYPDPRIKLVCHEQNRGQCPTRNTGVAHSCGEWIVTLDSDDALSQDCLWRMRKHIDHAPSSVGRLGFMYSKGHGLTAPHPAPEYALLEYVGWLRFIDTRDDTNLLWCTRRATFDSVRFPDSTVSPTEYGLAFARRFGMLLVPEVLGVIHLDADNRLTAARAPNSAEQVIRRARDYVASATRMLNEDGVALRKFAPRQHEQIQRSLSVSLFILGQRRQGLRYAVHYINKCEVTCIGIASIVLAFISPTVFFDIQHRRAQLSKTAASLADAEVS